MLRFLIVWFALLVLGWDKVMAHSSTTSSAVPTHVISVGIEGLQFTPPESSANVGDVIEFRFYPQNHSVARAEYGSKRACIPYEVTGINKQGFWSGFHPINVVLNDPPKFQVVVNDTNPIFFYCSAPGACHEDGMIGVVNANSTQTLTSQLEYAKNSSLQFSPGENFPVEGTSSPSSTAHPTSTSSSGESPNATTSPSTIIVTGSSSSSSSSKLSPGAIAGIALGASSLVLLASALLYLCGRQRTIKEIIHHNSRSPNMTSHAHPNPRHPGNSNPQSYIAPSATLSETTYYNKPQHLMTEQEIRGLGQFSRTESENHSHLSDSNIGSERYGRSRSRSPGADEYGMVIPPLNLGGSGSGSGGKGVEGSANPIYHQGNGNTAGNASLPNSPGMSGSTGVQMGMGEIWERERESERMRGLRSSPPPGIPTHFHSHVSSSGPHELATHHDRESSIRGHNHDRYDDPEIDTRLANQRGGDTFFWDEGESR
ncbi:hypothetical protein BOTCAL_0016g00050 [Botryotinia calthae]|uniref:Phytocyanin domain-containing protein n=1 Tax=Botryotinia calthae TaxID=38488 RepID=A0A4Y8DFH1_9HELO|nr:hypothetical protein BOTCAL_0016g00050 [Botryotinia calthae]